MLKDKPMQKVCKVCADRIHCSAMYCARLDVHCNHQKKRKNKDEYNYGLKNRKIMILQ